MSNRYALTGKGIQYWEIIPKVFHFDAETDLSPAHSRDQSTNGCAILCWPIRWLGRKINNPQ